MSRLLPVCFLFALEAFVFSNWIPRIPDFKDALNLSEATLGLCLLAAPIGTLLGFPFAGRVINWIGTAKAACITVAVFSLSLGLFGLFVDIWTAVLALLLVGFTVSFAEVAINTMADEIGRDGKGTVMSRCHGSWSVGSMLGAFAGGILASVGFSLTQHFTLISLLSALAALLMLFVVKETKLSDENEPKEGEAFFVLPTASLALLCIMPVGIMIAEGIMIDWSALFLKTIHNLATWETGVFYSIFSGVMAATRFSGDWLTEKYGPKRIVLASGIAAALGLTIFALSPNLLFAGIGCVLSGFGVAIVYPLTMSAAARRPGRTPSQNVSSVALISFSAFVAAPPLIGLIAEISSLKIAFLCFIPLCLLTAALAGEAVVKKEQKPATVSA